MGGIEVCMVELRCDRHVVGRIRVRWMELGCGWVPNGCRCSRWGVMGRDGVQQAELRCSRV